MIDKGLLDGIRLLHELTTLKLRWGYNLTAQAFSMFLHEPSMISVVSLNLSRCYNLDDEGLEELRKDA
jgi:hypothetical protein